MDADSDGLTNHMEFVAGTDPLNPVSVLRLIATLEPSGDLVLRFRAVAGRSYSLEERPVIQAGDWQPVHQVSPSTDQEVTFPIGTSDGAAFYRVVTRGSLRSAP
jgi:hypothetical protein